MSGRIIFSDKLGYDGYLGGKTLHLIAELTGISKTSVFNIVQDMASHDPDMSYMMRFYLNTSPLTGKKAA